MHKATVSTFGTIAKTIGRFVSSGRKNAKASAAVAGASRAAVESLESRLFLAANVTGVMKQWQPVTLTYNGPTLSETSNAPNPFLDYRLNVTFTGPSGQSYVVPGYFDGDGNGGGTGNVWRTKFTPDAPGTWSYKTSFRTGNSVAVDLNPSAGSATSFDNNNGSFNVGSRDANAPGFLKWGRLEYVGKHYLKFRDGGYYIKSGENEPEDFMSYYGFDDAPGSPRSYTAHAKDWQNGDPDWGGGKGKNIIGAINYLATQGVNEMFTILMSIGGRTGGRYVSPFAGNLNLAGSSNNDNKHYDVGRLREWDIVFSHMQAKGMNMQLVLGRSEAANKNELDNATLGVERKLYYRELSARFSYHNAITWNINEEYDWDLKISPTMIKSWAGYLDAVDPYDHPITILNADTPQSSFGPFYGDARFSTTAVQRYERTGNNGGDTEAMLVATQKAGMPLPINMDELRAATGSNADAQRKEITWPHYLSGAAGVAWYTEGVVKEDFRTVGSIYSQTAIARRFMEKLPVQDMSPMDPLLTGETNDGKISGGQVFGQKGKVYVIYYPNATATGSLNLSGDSATFTQQWFNPRTGQYAGSSKTVSGGGSRAIGAPPSDSGNDWVTILTTNGAQAPSVPTNPTTPTAPATPTTPTSGNGLNAKYWNNMDFTGTTKTRVDANINFDWQYNSPIAGIDPTTFAAKWTGSIQAPKSETFTFYARADDAVRVYINGQKILEHWGNGAATEYTGKYAMTAGQKYNIIVEYYQNTGRSALQLSWSSASVGKQIIPSSALFTATVSSPAPTNPTPAAPATPAAQNGLNVTYWNNTDFTGTAFYSRDVNLNFDWQYNSPATGIDPTTWSARWTGKILAPKTETYTFYVKGDDGIRIWVNGQKLVDNWRNGSMANEFSGKINLTAGVKYDIKIEFFQNTGRAGLQLLWSTPTIVKAVVPSTAFFTA